MTTNGIENNILTPITIGCLVVFALKPDSDYEIILQTRSEKNVTANAVTSVAPICGLSPFIGDSRGNRGLLYYNFVREYLEELHCIRETRELERQDLTRRSPEAYYEWLYDIEPAKKLMGCEYFDLHYIGFGFNLANGGPNIGLVAKLDDSAMSQEIKRSIFFNWEVDAVDFVGVKSGKLGRLFSTRQLDPASSFFISRALKYLT